MRNGTQQQIVTITVLSLALGMGSGVKWGAAWKSGMLVSDARIAEAVTMVRNAVEEGPVVGAAYARAAIRGRALGGFDEEVAALAEALEALGGPNPGSPGGLRIAGELERLGTAPVVDLEAEKELGALALLLVRYVRDTRTGYDRVIRDELRKFTRANAVFTEALAAYEREGGGAEAESALWAEVDNSLERLRRVTEWAYRAPPERLELARAYELGRPIRNAPLRVLERSDWVTVATVGLTWTVALMVGGMLLWGLVKLCLKGLGGAEQPPTR